MKQVFFFTLVSFFSCHLSAQQISVSNKRNNFFYIELDNPITVAAENCSCKDLVVKTNNGNIAGKGCQLIYRGKEVGSADIIVYKKMGSKIKEIGRSIFRVKRLPAPTFKIGPYGSSYNQERKVKRIVLVSQQYVRAELEGFDFDAKFSIDSFSVKIFYAESGKSDHFINTTGKIGQQISAGFSVLKKDDIVIFYSIFATGPAGQQYELAPLILTIEK